MTVKKDPKRQLLGKIAKARGKQFESRIDDSFAYYAQKHTAHDLQLAGQMRREDYKTIKHMDKATLAAYLSRVWKRGYDAGYQAAVKSVAPQLREAAELKAADKEG